MALLIGDATATYTIADTSNVSTIIAAKFTAASTGTVDQLQFRTNGTANTGLTGLILGIYADNGSGTNPGAGAAIGQGTASGLPAINTWITVSGLSISVVSGTIYWLAALATGVGAINFNEAVASGGTLETFSTSSNATLSAATWGATQAVGPIGFQGLSTVSARPFGSPNLPFMAPQGGIL